MARWFWGGTFYSLHQNPMMWKWMEWRIRRKSIHLTYAINTYITMSQLDNRSSDPLCSFYQYYTVWFEFLQSFFRKHSIHSLYLICRMGIQQHSKWHLWIIQTIAMFNYGPLIHYCPSSNLLSSFLSIITRFESAPTLFYKKTFHSFIVLDFLVGILKKHSKWWLRKFRAIGMFDYES